MLDKQTEREREREREKGNAADFGSRYVFFSSAAISA